MKKVALLIGVSEYEPGLNPLPAAVNDVSALEKVLSDAEIGAFDEVKVLTNPDRQNMQYEIETLFTERYKDDFVLLFFSGHGIKDDSNRLYFASRITRKSAKGNLVVSTAVPAQFIHEVMNRSRARRQVLILDCCFSGAFDPALQTKDDGSVDLKNQLGSEGRVVLASSSSTQYSFEQQGSELSLYTRYLVEGLETGAGDDDEDGKISMRELHDYATSKVQETAPNITPKLITLKELGFDIVLAKAKVTNPRLRYRKQVEKYASHGQISSIGRTILEQRQIQLAISPEVAKAIEEEVTKPYQERLSNLHRYRQVYSDAIEEEYPLSNRIESELRDLREILGLRQEDVSLIEQEASRQVTKRRSDNSLNDQQKHQRPEQGPNKESELEKHTKNALKISEGAKDTDLHKSFLFAPRPEVSRERTVTHRPSTGEKHQQLSDNKQFLPERIKWGIIWALIGALYLGVLSFLSVYGVASYFVVGGVSGLIGGLIYGRPNKKSIYWVIGVAVVATTIATTTGLSSIVVIAIIVILTGIIGAIVKRL